MITLLVASLIGGALSAYWGYRAGRAAERRDRALEWARRRLL